MASESTEAEWRNGAHREAERGREWDTFYFSVQQFPPGVCFMIVCRPIGGAENEFVLDGSVLHIFIFFSCKL